MDDLEWYGRNRKFIDRAMIAWCWFVGVALFFEGSTPRIVLVVITGVSGLAVPFLFALKRKFYKTLYRNALKLESTGPQFTIPILLACAALFPNIVRFMVMSARGSDPETLRVVALFSTVWCYVCWGMLTAPRIWKWQRYVLRKRNLTGNNREMELLVKYWPLRKV